LNLREVVPKLDCHVDGTKSGVLGRIFLLEILNSRSQFQSDEARQPTRS